MYSFSKNKNKPVYFTDDILEELSVKTGKDKKLLADIISNNIKYIKDSISKDEEIVVINFPNFGKLLFNYYLGGCSIVRTKNNKLKAGLKSRVGYLYKLLKMKNGDKLKNFNKPIVSTLTYNLLGKTPRNIINVFYKSWKILEDKHNKDHEHNF